MKKKIVSIAVMLSIISLVHGAAGPSSSSDTSVPMARGREILPLKRRAIQALIPHPGMLAAQFDMINYDPKLQSQLFVESVNTPLGSRFGLRAPANSNLALKYVPLFQVTIGGFSSDGSLIAISSGNANGENITFVINTTTGAMIRPIAGQFRGFSPDGNSIAVADWNTIPGCGDKTRLINIKDGATIWEIAKTFKGFNPDGSSIAVGVKDVDSDSRSETHLTDLINIKDGTTIRQIAGEFKGFSHDGSTVVQGFRNATWLLNPEYAGYWTNLIDTATGILIRSIPGPFGGFSPDENLIAVSAWNNSADYRLKTHLIDIKTGAEIRQIAGGFQGFSLDGNSVAVKKYDDLYLIDIATGKTIWQLTGSFGGFSPDGRSVAISLNNAAANGRSETHLINITTGEATWKTIGLFKEFNSDGTMMLTGIEDFLILTKVDFRSDLEKITDSQQRKFLLNAAQAWLDKKAYPVDDNNYSLYQKIIERIPYLNDPLLFDVVETPQGIYAASRADLDEYANRVSDADDPQLKDLALRTYDAWYDVQKAQDEQKKDRDILAAFLKTIKARHVWRVVRQHADALTNNYQADRAARLAQRAPQVPTSSSSHDTMADAASQPGTSEPVVGSSQDGVRAPDAPVTMRLFD